MAPLILWGIFPAALAFVGLSISIGSFARSPTIVQGLLGLPAILAYIGSVIIIAQMFLYSGWPTFLPHIAIGAAFATSLLQSSLAGPPRSTRQSEDA